MSELIGLLALIPLGFLVGGYGTLIGAGGGFVLVPILLLLYPRENPEIITSISLAVVFFNALSGTWAYAKMGRIHYRSALLFSAAAIPGAVLGALSTAAVPRRLFDALLGALMLVAAGLLAWRSPVEELAAGHGGFAGAPGKSAEGREESAVGQNASPTDASDLFDSPIAAAVPAPSAAGAAGYRTGVGVWLSVFVGYIAALLGIGGGVIHVPVLVRAVKMPVHVATATSHLMLAIMAGAGTIVHIVTGNFQHGYRRTIMLSVGVIVGAQLGAYLSGKIHGRWILNGLAAALALVALRVLLLAWSPAGV